MSECACVYVLVCMHTIYITNEYVFIQGVGFGDCYFNSCHCCWGNSYYSDKFDWSFGTIANSVINATTDGSNSAKGKLQNVKSCFVTLVIQ